MRISKGTKAFYIIYGILTLTAVIIILLTLNYFKQFLTDYEAHLPEKMVDAYISKLQNGDFNDFFANVSFNLTEFETADAFKNEYLKFIGSDFSYSRIIKESTEENPVYIIKSGDVQIAKLYLKPSFKKSNFGFVIYETEKTVLNELPVQSVNITAPSNTDVFLNGVKLNEEYIIQEEQAYPETRRFYNYIDNPPSLVTYEIEGFINLPLITATDLHGRELVMNQSNTFGLTENFDSALAEKAADFCMRCTKYISNDAAFNSVAVDIPPELPLYDSLSYYENKFFAWHNGYKFKNVTVENMIFYTENCFSANVKYDHIIYAGNEFVFPVDYTVYFANIGGTWMVTDLVLN